MKRLIAILGGAIVLVGIVTAGFAQIPGETPFPEPVTKNVFVSTRTVTAPGSTLGAGALSNFYAQGETVVFEAFAGAVKSGKVLTAKDVKFFYVSVPGQPPVKLTYRDDPRWPWTATWKIPADYPVGLVPFKTLLRTSGNQYGTFVQIPVATSQLTVTKA